MIRFVVRVGMTLADRVRRIAWRHSKRPIAGVRAIVLTPDGKVVLVRHSYTQGWYLPTGGAKPGEDHRHAILRELREEIGLIRGEVAAFDEEQGLLDRRPHSLTTFVVRSAVYRPRWSLEIEEVGAFALDALPPDLSPLSRSTLAAFLKKGVGAA